LIIGYAAKSLEKNHNYSYAKNMTLSERNLVFKLGIALSFLCLVISIIISLKVLSVYALMQTEITRRSESIFRTLIEKFFEAKLLAVHGCIVASVVYSFFSIIFIHYFFEKTQSPEILFVVFFAASFSLEALRLIIPLGRVYELPSLYQLMAARIILFSRYFGLFSLFTAGVFASGFKSQQQRNIIIIITVTTLIITLGVPIDTQTWDSGMNMINGYTSMFRLIEAGTFLLTIISFFIAAWSRSSLEFVFIGAGSALAFLGRNILLNADTWAGLPIGLLFLAAGTWLICTRLHKVYLWL